jgi:hypothetical protein
MVHEESCLPLTRRELQCGHKAAPIASHEDPTGLMRRGVPAKTAPNSSRKTKKSGGVIV